MKIVPFENARKEWDAMVRFYGRDEFWATTHWLEYQRAYGNTNASFAVIDDDGQVLAVVPVIITPAHTVATNIDDPCPGPVSSRFSGSDLCNLIDAEYRRILHKHKVVKATWWAHDNGGAEPLKGLLDPSEHSEGIVADVHADGLVEDCVAAHWSGTRKSYRSLIGRGLNHYIVVRDLTGALMPHFQAVHLADAGRITRPQETWDMMRQWIRDGYAMLIALGTPTEWLAFSFWITYNGWAYYASAASIKKNTLHPVQWAGFKELCSDTAIDCYELGWKRPGDDPIAFFKEGFGHTDRVTHNVWTWER